jgi:Nucleotidyl transferase AbiEii toxin, Type IV TA system
MSRTYASPEAFKQALESHIRVAARQRAFPIGRMRQLFIAERLLVRLHAGFGDRVIAKGGLVLELRLSRARTTKDLDLRLNGSAASLLRDLEAAVSSDQSDWLVFRIRTDDTHPTIDGDGVVYEGHRFVARATLAGKPYGDPFGVDVGFGDVLTEGPDVVEGSDVLNFIGAERPRFRIYPRAAHIAEKLHAYTMPRARENTRVKDLPDIALLATTGPFSAAAVRAALEATFLVRGTHALPERLPPPPATWVARYFAMATSDGLDWKTLDAVYAAAEDFVNPVLSGLLATWEPANWRWGDGT